MAARSETRTWNTVFTLVLEKFFGTKQIADNIFNDLSAIRYMRKDSQVEYINGGDHIVVPLMYGKNDGVASYRGGDTLNCDPQDTHTSARFDWRQVSGPITMTGLESAADMSDRKIKSVLKARINNTVLSLEDKLNYFIFRDGSGNNYKDVTGLAACIPETTSSGTYGGINRANESWWRNQSISCGSFSASGLKKMRQMWRTVSANRKNGYSTVIFMTANAYGYYEEALEVKGRFPMGAMPKGGDPSFAKLAFKDIPCEFDTDMPQDGGSEEQQYWLNTRFLKLATHPKRNFKTSRFVTPHDQDVSIAHVFWYGELVCNNARHQGLLHSITE